MTTSPEVYVVQVLAEELDTEDLDSTWRERVEDPVSPTHEARLSTGAPL